MKKFKILNFWLDVFLNFKNTSSFSYELWERLRSGDLLE